MLIRALLVPALVAPAYADVLEVGVGLDHSTLQEAVDAAADGDVILLRENQPNDGAVIQGKALTVLGLPPNWASDLSRVQSRRIAVRDLAADQEVCLGNLRIVDDDLVFGVFGGALQVHDSAGRVLVQDCVMEGTVGNCDSPAFHQDGSPGLRVEGSDNVVLVGSEAVGGPGDSAGNVGYPTSGGYGVFGRDSTLSLYDSIAIAGPTGSLVTEDGNGWPGAHGLDGINCFVYAARCSFTGANGGGGVGSFYYGYFCNDGGSGGDGVKLTSGGALRHVDCSFFPGAGGSGVNYSYCDPGSSGSSGVDIFVLGGSEDIPLAGRTPIVTARSVQAPGAVYDLEIDGLSGGAYLVDKGSPDLRYLGAFEGLLHFEFVGYPDFFRKSRPLGPVTSGTTVVQRTAPTIPDDRILRIQEQIWIRRVGGHRLANPRITWVIGASY